MRPVEGLLRDLVEDRDHVLRVANQFAKQPAGGRKLLQVSTADIQN
jgi:hypothetical protein